MTHDEFLMQMSDAEREIRRHVLPLGIIYSVRLASGVAGPVLVVLLFLYFFTAARTAILFELGFCILLFGASFPVERQHKARFVRLALKCPSCQSCLVFLRNDRAGEATLETGCCYHCGRRVFEV